MDKGAVRFTGADVRYMMLQMFKARRWKVFGLTPKQELAMDYLTDRYTREILFGGAAGGGKSTLGCFWLTFSALCYPRTRYFISRKVLKDIRESTMLTFHDVFERYGVLGVKYNDPSVRLTFPNGSFISGLQYSVQHDDPEFARFGSREYTSGWHEESGEMDRKPYSILLTRVGRVLNSQNKLAAKVLLTMNPQQNFVYDDFYKPYIQGRLTPDRQFIQSKESDNPHLSEDYRSILRGLTGSDRVRLYEGGWDYDNSPDALLDVDALNDLFNNDHLEPDTANRYMIVDAAMYGSDLFRVGVFYGDVLMEAHHMEKSGGRDIVDLIRKLQQRHNIPPSHVVYDADGVGGFIGGDGGFIRGARPFHANAKPVETFFERLKHGNIRQYANLKSQCAFLLADDVNNGQVWAKCVTHPDEQRNLKDELRATLKNQPTNNLLLAIVSKDRVKAAIGHSPDFADLFIMSRYWQLINKIGIRRKSRSV